MSRAVTSNAIGIGAGRTLHGLNDQRDALISPKRRCDPISQPWPSGAPIGVAALAHRPNYAILFGRLGQVWVMTIPHGPLLSPAPAGLLLDAVRVEHT
jgi:hypothetical protein